MYSEESILLRAASNMAGRASRLSTGRPQQAMMWMAQMFIMADRNADMNYLVRCCPMSKRYKQSAVHMSIVDVIRMRSKPSRLASSYKEYRHGL